MRMLSLCAVLMSLVGCGVEVREPDGVAEDEVAAEALSTARFNRTLTKLSLTQNSQGKRGVTIDYDLAVADGPGTGQNYTADLVVSVNGRVVDRLLPPAQVQTINIQCQLHCNGYCGPLGSCKPNSTWFPCGCRSTWFTTWFFELKPGDTVVVKVVPSRGGLPEVDTSDDQAKIVVQ